MRRQRFKVGLLLVLGLLAGMIAHAINPTRDAWLPRCPFHELTGLWCPFCGSTRAAAALAHGNPLAMLRHNALFLPAIALLVWVWFITAAKAFAPSVSDRRWSKNPLRSTSFVRWLIGVLVVFWIVRNLPGAPQHALSQ